MGALQDFLNGNIIEDITKEVIISERFKDKDGNFLKFKIKAMTEDEYENARRGAVRIGKKGKTDFDNKKFSYSVIINNTIEPNFKDMESIKKLGCVTAEQYISKVLLAGEISALAEEITRLSGFGIDIDELIEEVKN